MSQVAIQLPDELSQFVQESVDSGAYQNADAFFVSVVATFNEQVESRLTAEEEAKVATLQADVQHAAEQLDRGEGIRDFDWDAFLADRHRAHVARKSA